VTHTLQPAGFPEELLALLAIPGVSGYERPVVDHLRSRLPEGVDTRIDAIGNLTATFGAGGPHLLLIVHTDEVGFVVSGVRPDGALYLTAVGHWDLAALGGSQVDVHTTGGAVPGVVITVPPHLDRGLAGPPAWLEGDQVVVDVGSESPEVTAALGVRVLDSVTLVRQHAVLPGGQLVSRGLDNRFGCYLLLELARDLAERPPSAGRVTLAWASQEEVGFRGPKALAHRSRYDAVLAIDAYPADRRPHARLADDAVRLGAGPVLRGVDLTGVGSMRFVRGIERLARDHGLPLQPAYAQGHNQASVFPTSFAAALDLPIAYLHSGVECVSRSDLDTAGALLRLIVAHPDREDLWS
jgi:putative aminopeptidase FrvX